MPVAILIVLGILAYVGYQFSPVPQCLHIAKILDDVGDNTAFAMNWGFSDKVACVFASEGQRQTWLTSAEVFRFNAFQLNQTMRPTSGR